MRRLVVWGCAAPDSFSVMIVIWERRVSLAALSFATTQAGQRVSLLAKHDVYMATLTISAPAVGLGSNDRQRCSASILLDTMRGPCKEKPIAATWYEICLTNACGAVGTQIARAFCDVRNCGTAPPLLTKARIPHGVFLRAGKGENVALKHRTLCRQLSMVGIPETYSSRER
jgi:hypothetical protein